MLVWCGEPPLVEPGAVEGHDRVCRATGVRPDPGEPAAAPPPPSAAGGPRRGWRPYVLLGGTVLGTTNRGNPFQVREKSVDGTTREVDVSDRLIAAFGEHGIDAHVAVGGDGSLTIANQLHAKGLRVVGVPKTIDNDLQATFATFGFASAVSFATECIDRLRARARLSGEWGLATVGSRAPAS